MAEKDLSYYRGLPYRRRVRPEHDEVDGHHFVAWIDEPPGLEVDGDTRYEALYNLGLAFDDYIAAALEWGDEIKEPEVWPSGLLGHRTNEPSAPVEIEGTFEGHPSDLTPLPQPGLCSLLAAIHRQRRPQDHRSLTSPHSHAATPPHPQGVARVGIYAWRTSDVFLSPDTLREAPDAATVRQATELA